MKENVAKGVSSDTLVGSASTRATERTSNSHKSDANLDDGRVTCPCQDFAALAKIVNVLSSDDRTRSIIDWLNGDTDQIAIAEQKLLTCGKRYQCRYRYGTSFAILDAIKDATAPFLQDSASPSGVSSKSNTSPKLHASKESTTTLMDYEAAFPPLRVDRPHPAASNIFVPPKTAQGSGFPSSFNAIAGSTTANTLPTRKKKSKGRIRLQKVDVAQAPSVAFGLTEEATEKDPKSVVSLQQRQASAIPSEDNATNHAASATPREEFPEDHLDRLVEIYVALIRNMLVPSTPAQLFLILRLLLVEPAGENSLSTSGKNGEGPFLFFRPVFSSPARCILFAQKALTQLQRLMILQRLGLPLVRALAQSKLIQYYCPVIAEELKRYLECDNAEPGLHPLESVTPHAILSIPFEKDRDSRHNYRTQSEVALYKNREETRDAFLSQLRTFMTAKSRAFLSQDVDKVRSTAQHESRRIISNISNINMVWFTQFFCELLLQVGLSPVEEMDQELLSFVRNDKDRLQKLHKRMYGNSPHDGRKTTSRRSNHGNNGGASGGFKYDYRAPTGKNHASPSALYSEVLQEFPGYQEFFFLFLDAADSYKLGIHLSHQLAKNIMDAISDRSTIGLEKRMLDLQMLGRFLGCLIFSPHWHVESVDWNKLKPLAFSSDQGLKQLQFVGLDLPNLVRDAWMGKYTLLVIPCVAEMLKMSKWDSLIQSSRAYRQLLADLRWIQRAAALPHNENLQIVAFHLETLFHETVTLPKLTSLPPSRIADEAPTLNKSEFLDAQKVILSPVAINNSSPSMESLHDMIMEGINRRTDVGKKKPKPRVVRKVQPLVVSTPLTKMQSYLGIESPVAKMSSPNETNELAGLMPDDKMLSAQRKLEDAFFHQHRSLKDICDFVIDQTSKTLSAQDLTGLVSQAVAENQTANAFVEDGDEKIQERGMQLSRIWLREHLKTKLMATLQVLVLPKLEDKLINVAVELSLARGMKSSEMLLHRYVSELAESKGRALNDINKKQQRDRNPVLVEFESAVRDATRSLSNLRQKFSTTGSKENHVLVAESLRLVQIVADSVYIPSDEVLRDFFAAVFALDRVADLARKTALERRSEDSWEAFLSFLHLISSLSRLSVYGTKHITSMFGADFDTFLLKCEAAHGDERMVLLQSSVSTLLSKATQETPLGCGRNDGRVAGPIEPRKIDFH
jgi:hypothetical protein